MGTEFDRELQQLQDELKQGKLSRRDFINRLTKLGVGAGAAYMLGIHNAYAHAHLSRDVRIASTDPALNTILSDGVPGPQSGRGLIDTEVAQLPLPHPPPPLPHPPPPYYRYDRQYSSYDRHEPPPYSRYDRTYTRYDRTYSR